MKKIILYLLTSIAYIPFLYSCNEQSGMEEKMRALRTDVACEEISIPFDIGNNIQMLHIEDFIVFNDFYTDPMLTVYSTKSDSVVSKFLTKGRGPNELLPPVELYYFRDSIYIHDRNSNHLYGIPFETIALKENINLIKKWEGSPSVSAMLPLDNNTFIASGSFTDNRFVILNGKGEITKSFGEYPSFMSNEKRFSNEGKFMFHQSFFLKNPKNSKIAVYTSHVLEIYEYGGEGLTQQVQILLSPYEYSCETGTILRANASPDTKKGVRCAQCDDKYIYLLFSHKAPQSTERLTEIWIFDWMGNPVKCLKPDKNILSFCVDDDQNTIYAIDDEAQLDRIRLDAAI